MFPSLVIRNETIAIKKISTIELLKELVVFVVTMWPLANYKRTKEYCRHITC